MCRELGLHSVKLELPESTTHTELRARVGELNADSRIHGILVQSPTPEHIDEAAIVRAFDPRKDVDGFHPENVAKLVLDDPSGFVPCTPLGVQRLLTETKIVIDGAHVVVLGRSMIVGKPLALLLMQKNKNGNATVTVVHSRSRNLAAITRSADIVVAAIGRAEFLKADHVREGAVVIDVGINRVEDAANERGYRLVGRSEEHTSELQSQSNLVCRLLLEKKKTAATSRPSPRGYRHAAPPAPQRSAVSGRSRRRRGGRSPLPQRARGPPLPRRSRPPGPLS